MYEETKSSIDWKGIFLKVIIAFLIVLIAVKGYSTLKGNNKKNETTSETVAESKSSSTFTENIEKLRNAGEKYFTTNTDKLPKSEGNTTMVTLNELISAGDIDTLVDEEGKTCDGESSYVTAVLEGDKTKLKANLVCGSASSYSLVYMGENDEETKTNDSKTTSTSTSYSNTSSTSNSSKSSSNSNSCGSSCQTSTPSVNVSTNTSVSQNVSINTGSSSKKTNSSTNKNNTSSSSNNSSSSNSNKNNTTTYRVSFDSNGGNTSYATQKVVKYNTAYNPGETYKSGYTFKGWYLNGSKYDFSTPVTSNITLTAKFVKNSSSYDYDDDDYDYDYTYNTIKTKTYSTSVYSVMWDTYGTNNISVNHTLQVPEAIEEKNVEKVKIKSVSVSSALTTSSQLSSYNSKFYDTFYYSKNGWEYRNLSTSNLAKVNKSYVSVEPLTSRYKDIDDAIDEGFEVEWNATRVSSQCKSSFDVYGPNGEVSYNNCGYGIVYKVTWEYQYYN